jgi:hypothetical protein
MLSPGRCMPRIKAATLNLRIEPELKAADRSLTIEYRPDFNRADRPVAEQDYINASLLAMQKLCKSKGYRMIGAHRHGFNVLFLRQDEGTKFFPEVSIEQIHDNHWTRLAQVERWPVVKDMPWVEV